MTHTPSIEDLLNALLGEADIAQGLTEDEKATIRAMVQSLPGDLQGELNTLLQSPHETTVSEDSPIYTMLTELGIVADLRSQPAVDEPLDAQKDSTLVEALGNHVENANEVVEVLATRPVSQQALNALRRVELQLTALTIGVGDLRQVLEQNFSPQFRRWQRSVTALLHRFQFHQHSGRSVIKPRHVALFALMFCLPFGLKLGVPALIDQGIRLGWLARLAQGATPQEPHSDNSSLHTVESIQNGILLIKTPAGATLRVKLLGLTLGGYWQNQAEGVIAMLLQPVQAKVVLSHMRATETGLTEAIVTLPNGTPLQEVLLANGLAKLNLNPLKALPENLVLRLQQAEATAKLQHKNVWGEHRN